MKLTLFILFSAFTSPFLFAGTPAAPVDPFAGAFFPPDLVMRAHDQIGVTPEQQKVIQERLEKVGQRSEELKGKMDRETAALAELARPERVNEKEINAQLDKVLDLERELKHLHVSLVVEIKNLLTPEQQAKLHEIAKDGGTHFAEDTRVRLTQKVEQIKAAIQKWAEGGRDPSAIGQAMEEKFKPLIQAGKINEAEAELDRILGQLKSETK